jgi:hypothetical protein
MLLAVLTGPEGPTKPSDFEWPPVRAIQSQSNRIREIAQKMRLSSKEANWLGRFIAGTLLPYLDHPVGRREIFRILKTAKDASPALVFFSMARSLTAQSPLTDGDGWHTQVQNARKTFETYWEEGDQVVAGSSLISGTDLMESLGIEPGPKLGRMLLALGEARFVGEIRTREDAIEMARKMMNDETVKRG